MSPIKVRGGWKNPGAKNKPLSKKKAIKKKLAKGGIIRKKKRLGY
jgi:hypothetical protein